MQALEKEGWLKVLHPQWCTAKVDANEMAQWMKTRQLLQDAGYTVDAAPLAFYFLTKRMADKDLAEMQRLLPHKEFVTAWQAVEENGKELAKKLGGKEASTPSRAWRLLSSAKPDAILFLDVTSRQQAVSEKIKNYFGKWRQVQQKLPLPEMAEMRITPQLAEYPKIAEEAFLLLLDGKLRNHTEIVKFLKPYEPPPPPPPPAPMRRRGAKAAGVKAQAAGAATAGAKRGRKPKGAPAPAVPARASCAGATADRPTGGRVASGKSGDQGQACSRSEIEAANGNCRKAAAGEKAGAGEKDCQAAACEASRPEETGACEAGGEEYIARKEAR